MNLMKSLSCRRCGEVLPHNMRMKRGRLQPYPYCVICRSASNTEARAKAGLATSGKVSYVKGREFFEDVFDEVHGEANDSERDKVKRRLVAAGLTIMSDKRLYVRNTTESRRIALSVRGQRAAYESIPPAWKAGIVDSMKLFGYRRSGRLYKNKWLVKCKRTVTSLRRRGNGASVIRQTELFALLEEQAFMCALTGDTLTPENSSLDHKDPVFTGGDNGLRNLQWVTKDANSAKGTIPNAQFLDLCRKVVAHDNSKRRQRSQTGEGEEGVTQHGLFVDQGGQPVST